MMSTGVQKVTSRVLPMLGAAIAAAVLAAGLSAVLPAEAHAASTINRTILSGSYDDGGSPTQKTVTKYDVTGDGQSDMVKIRVGKKNIRVFVNGKLRGTFKRQGNTNFKVRYMRTSDRRPYVYVELTGGDNGGTGKILQLRKGKLRQVTSVDMSDDASVDRVWAKGKKIRVRYTQKTPEATVSPRISGLVYRSGSYSWSAVLL